jgi:pimeloyl-ACP methyl ester carboxylesterase
MHDSVQSGQQFAEINGTRLWYETAGTGHPLVLMHAGICDSRMWDAQWRELAQRFRIIRYDVRGFGRSPMPSDPFAHRDDLHALLTLLKVERAYLVAASMAGRIAIELTLEHPEMVDAIVLVGSGVGETEPSEALIAGWEQVEAAVTAGELDRAVELELALWVDGPGRTPEDVDPAIRERVREMNRNNFAVGNDDAEERVLDPPARDRLREIRVPALIIAGDQDQPHVLASAEHFRSTLPNADVVIMPGTAHLPSMEQPTVFNQLVIRFLERVAPPA